MALDPGRPPGIQPLENSVPDQGNVDPRAMLPLAPARDNNIMMWCESTLLEDPFRAALRVISALSALRWSKMIFRRFAQSRIAFSENLRNMPSINFSDLLDSALNLEIRFIHKVFRERCLGRKNVQTIYVLREQHEMKF